MKKQLLSLLLLIATFCPMGGFGFFRCHSWNFDPYIGIAGGMNTFSGSYRSTANTGEFHLNASGGVGGLVGATFGVQSYFLCNAFLALQGNLLYNSYDKGQRVDFSPNIIPPFHFRVHLKNCFQGGIDARLGWSICDATPYFIIGTEAGNWKRTLSNDSEGNGRGVPPFSRITKTKCLWGPKIGTGLTFPILPCVWANFEYSYIWFGEITQILTDPATSLVWEQKDTIRQSSILVGLNYLF